MTISIDESVPQGIVRQAIHVAAHPSLSLGVGSLSAIFAFISIDFILLGLRRSECGFSN
jgi:hypothetical protein